MRSAHVLVAALTMLSVGAVPAMAAGVAPVTDVAGEAAGSDIALLVAFVAMALVISFLCSIAEAVLLSITPSYIEGLREAHARLAETLRHVRQESIDRSLAAILTLNTIAHTAGAIGAGAQAAIVFGSTWTGIFSALMTLAILFLSEIVPKTIGAVYWRALVRPTALFIRFLTFALYPLVRISEWITQLIARGRDVHVFSRQEFIAMADVAEERGHIDVHESRIFRNLFRFESLKARDAMTPRTVMMAFPETMTVQELLAEAERIPFSRLPVYSVDTDHITGMVLKDDVLMTEARDEGDRTLASLKREMPAVPTAMALSRLLEFFLEERHHMAIVVDEHGGTSGLITLEDLIETLLGMEIVDESDSVEDMQVLARRLAAERSAAVGRVDEEGAGADEHAW